MKAISLWQPWAHAIAVGKKTIETRHWHAPRSIIGQRIAIHAAKRPIKRGEISSFYCSPSWGFIFDEWRELRQLDYGGIVCTAIFQLCASTDALLKSYPSVVHNQIEYGNFCSGRFGWVFRDIQPIKFIPYRGMQGFFNIPDELLETT